MTFTQRIALMISKGRTDGIQAKLDTFLLYDRITDAEYTELATALKDKLAEGAANNG